MLFWLAAKLHVVDPDQLGEMLSNEKLQEWVAFYGVKGEYEKRAMDSSKGA